MNLESFLVKLQDSGCGGGCEQTEAASEEIKLAVTVLDTNGCLEHERYFDTTASNWLHEIAAWLNEQDAEIPFGTQFAVAFVGGSALVELQDAEGKRVFTIVAQKMEK